MYLRFNESNIVEEIIPDIDPTFPDIPINERYPAEFISKLRYCDDGTDVETGMQYNEETDSFEYPSPSPVVDFGGETATDTENTGDITQAEINLEVEYRLSCLELGIN